jgi:hypothetical protein
MFEPIHHKTATLSLPNSVNRSPLRRGFLLLPLALACFALSPTVRAVTPAPDGGYPNNNTAEGDSALESLTTGSGNTAIGSAALTNNTTGDDNTAIGFNALFFDTTGGFNTATGWLALLSNTTGIANTASGANALQSNTTGFDNTATGVEALFSNTTGQQNTATGRFALSGNTTGSNNTADGWEALAFNTTGTFNTASGFQTLASNTTGNFNTAIGWAALIFNTTGMNNTANGVGALSANTVGHNNAASGFQALDNNTSGSFNIALGNLAGHNLTTGGNNIEIGNQGSAGESQTIRIGEEGKQKATFIAGISGVTVAGGVGVVIDSKGHLGTKTSSERFKEAIKPMDKASEAILALEPVTFHYKHELDPEGIPQFGLIAEQVEKVNPDLVARDTDGKINTVRYEAVNAMLLNEFLKEHRTVQDLKKEVAALTATVKEQASQIKKVSDELEVSRPVPQIVADNQ